MSRYTALKLSRSILLAAILAVAGFVSSANAASSRLVSVSTPRGAKQTFILINPGQPVGAVILFAGGHGALGLSSAVKMKWGANNFLVRTRNMLAAKRLMVAVVDAPSDKPRGMNAIFRMSPAHAADIGAVAAYLKQQEDVPVWLVGTSMGTFSAANGAMAAKHIDGLVLTSTITRARPKWKIASSHKDGVASMPLQKITVPTLIVSHKNDGCNITPAGDASLLLARLERAATKKITLVEGGLPARSGPCKAKSAHGFLGVEDKAIDSIADFIRANAQLNAGARTQTGPEKK